MTQAREASTVVITGGNGGLGFEAAENIAADDLTRHVVLACRNASRGDAAAETLRRDTGNSNVVSMVLDLASLASVRAFAQAFDEASFPPLTGLVCNAGLSAAGMPGTTRTVDGFEPIFGVNHLGHFLLVNLLVTQMASGGRILFVTSDLHDPPAFFPVAVRYESAEKIRGGRSGMTQYCLSKLCNLYCTYELADRLRAEAVAGISVNAFNPGAMADTGFSRPSSNALTRVVVAGFSAVMGRLVGKRSTSAESGKLLGALVTDRSFEGITGAYFDRDERADSSPLSHDAANARELWAASVAMVRLTATESPFATKGT
jgi:NAD(P)-dependent dehydrogenase (short-subunit alcohol dehydrogenase family)